MVKFNGNYSLFTPTSPYAKLIQEAVWRGAGTIHKAGDQGFFSINDHRELRLQVYLSMARDEILITGYPVFIKCTTAEYSALTPTYLPNNSILLEDGSTYRRSWSEWKDATHHHRETETHVYVQGNSWGVELDSDIVLQLYNDGYTILDTGDYLEELNNEPSNSLEVNIEV